MRQRHYGSPAQKVWHFHTEFGVPMDHPPDRDLLDIRRTLIEEEATEACDALFDGDLAWIAKELADVVYVAYGAALSLGIDLDLAVRAVHESNMTKLGEDGKPVYRADGKVLKGPNYREADVRDSLPESYWKEIE